MPLETFDFCYKRPLQMRYIDDQNIFVPIEGDDEVIEVSGRRREFTLNILWQGFEKRSELVEFLYNHRKREPFFFTPEGDSTAIEVKLVSSPNEARMLAYGGFEMVIEEVNAMSIIELPTIPGNFSATGQSGAILFNWDASTHSENSISSYVLEISAPDSI